MSWMRQVSHVFVKDVRQFRVLWALYVLLGVTATLHAMGMLEHLAMPFDLTGFLFVIVGLVLAALHAQADSALTPNAFWASRPLGAGAVLAAKLLGLVVMLVTGVLLELWALDVNVSSATHVWPTLGGAAANYATCLVGAFALAVITTSLVSLLSAGLVLALGSGAILSLVLFYAHTSLDGPATATVLRIAACLSVLAIAWTLYSWRGSDRRARLAMIAPAVMIAASMQSSAGAITYTTQPLPSFDATLSDTASLATNGHATLVLTPTGRLAYGMRVTMYSPAVRFALSAGAVPLALKHDGPVTIYGPDSLLAGYRLATQDEDSNAVDVQVRRRGVNEMRSVTSAHVSGAAPDSGVADRQVLRRGIDWSRGIVSGDVSALAAVQHRVGTASMPLSLTATARLVGGKMSVDSLAQRASSFALRLRQRGTDAGEAQSRPYLIGAKPNLDVWLVNDARHEAIRLDQAEMMTNSAWMVLPGPNARVDYRTFRLPGSVIGTRETRMLPFRVDDAWIGGAHIMMNEWSPVEEGAIEAPLRIIR